VSKGDQENSNVDESDFAKSVHVHFSTIHIVPVLVRKFTPTIYHVKVIMEEKKVVVVLRD